MICNVQALFMIYIIQNDKPYCTSSLFVYIASGALSAGTDRVALGMASINYYSLDSFGATLTASKTALPSTPVLNCGCKYKLSNFLTVFTKEKLDRQLTLNIMKLVV